MVMLLYKENVKASIELHCVKKKKKKIGEL